MEINKIISIKNIGRFLNSTSLGDITFKACNLIFAENGRGKTTLCAIFRSLKTNEPAFILGRATLASPDPPEVKLLINGQPTQFNNGAWTQSFPDLIIFDGTYVTANVHSGDEVGTEQRRGLYGVIIGVHGVGLARRIEDLDSQTRAKSTQIREARAAVQRHNSHGIDLAEFLSLTEEPEIDHKIETKERELVAVKQADQIEKRGTIEAINLPNLPDSYSALLGKTLEGVSSEVEKQVLEHMKTHKMVEQGESWLSEGLGYVENENCPFCEQSLSDISLIDSYKTFFSEAYHDLKSEIADLSKAINAAIGDREIANLERILDLNNNNEDFWRQYCTFDSPVLDKKKLADIVIGLRQAALSLLTRKAGLPLETLKPDKPFQEALDSFRVLCKEVETYNATANKANSTILGKKKEAAAGNIQVVEAELKRLRSQKIRHSPLVRDACDGLQRVQNEKTDLESQKVQTREQLDRHTEQVIVQYGNSINSYLDRFNAGFRITQPSHNYRGGIASSSYQILINETPVNLGDHSTPLDQPSFKNTLSSGDRSTLALAFFLAELDRETEEERQRKVIILDDPFTSQDSFRRNATAQQIKRLGELFNQVIVLSHDVGFLKILWDKLDPALSKALQFVRMNENDTRIVEWDIEEAVRRRYQASLDSLQGFQNLNEGDSRYIIQQIRPVLEGHCRRVCSGQFVDDALGEIVGTIAGVGENHFLYPIVDKLSELNDYCRRYHHGENPNADEEQIDDNELQGYVRQTLRIVGCL